MSTSTKLGDEFLCIPKLEVSGKNWVIFKDQFTWALDAQSMMDHIDGTGKEPKDPISEAVRAKVTEEKPLTDEQKKLEIEWKKEFKEWRQGEAIMKQQIASSIPDSLFMKIQDKGAAYNIWSELRKHFEKRSRMVSIDLRQRLQEIRCAEKGNITEHLITLRTMREDLASMGETLTNADFYSIIMGSLPSSYDQYLSALNATSSVLGKQLSADDLMLTITEEYECRNLKSKGKAKDENAAFHADSKDKKGGKRKGNCNNCGKKGHWTCDCYAEGGGKEGQGPKQKEKKDKEKEKGKDKEKGKKGETAAVAKESDKDNKTAKEEEAWMAIPDIDDMDTLVLEEEMAYENELTEQSPESILNIPDLFDGIDELIDVEADEVQEQIKTDLEAAYLAGTDETCSAEIDLYDSGTTRHMTGFYHRLINYVDTDPIPIKTADKRTFQATGKGDMYIYLPNRDKSNSRILLKDVLYVPQMGITLVSISRVAGAGSTVVFTGNICRIYSKDREVIGEIKVKGGLHRVLTKGTTAYAYTAAPNNNEVLSLDELHRRLGHVSHDRAKLLVKKGLVEGVTLEEGTEVIICESCEWAKRHRKQVSKVHEDDRRKAVGDEIHSDLWGKAPVESINRKLYYVTFTDDFSRYTQRQNLRVLQALRSLVIESAWCTYQMPAIRLRGRVLER